MHELYRLAIKIAELAAKVECETKAAQLVRQN